MAIILKLGQNGDRVLSYFVLLTASYLYGPCHLNAMLTGLVCQLYYHGGGQLQYQNTLGVSSLVRFLSAPFVLQLGQKVSFSLLEAGEAVDLQHPASELIPTLTAKSDSKAKLAVRSVRFQRSIGRYP